MATGGTGAFAASGRATQGAAANQVRLPVRHHVTNCPQPSKAWHQSQLLGVSTWLMYHAQSCAVHYGTMAMECIMSCLWGKSTSSAPWHSMS